MTFIVVLVGWVFSLCLHEFSHALVAYYGGDYTVREKGYLTFNPLKYTHPVYSLLLPLLFLVLGGIGLPGGAVYIETWRLRSRGWVSAVSLAGPASNLLLAVLLGLLLRFAPVTSSGVWPGLAFLAFLVLWYIPFVNASFWRFVSLLARLAGVPLQLAALGFSQFRFWG